jgi:hypothetical protein
MMSQTCHQGLQSTIGMTKQVHTADTRLDASSLQHDLSNQVSRGSTNHDTGGTATTSTDEYSIAVSYNTSDHCDGCIDITDVTGNILYNSLIARSKAKLAERCGRESSRNPIQRKNIASALESISTISKAQSVGPIQCSRRPVISLSLFNKRSISIPPTEIITETVKFVDFTPSRRTSRRRRVKDRCNYSPRGLLLAREERISRLVDRNIAGTLTQLFGRIHH